MGVTIFWGGYYKYYIVIINCFLSLLQVTPRTLPEGSCRTRGAWENQAYPSHPSYPIPEQEVSDWARTHPRLTGDDRRRPWVETAAPCFSTESKHTGTSTAAAIPMTELPSKTDLTGERERRRSGVGGGGGGGISGIGGPVSRGGGTHLGQERAERAEQNWSRRGPSPIQRNILARKLREAQSFSQASDQRGRQQHQQHQQRQRSSTFSVSVSEQRKGRCRSLPLSGDYSSSGSPYGLSEAEQRMMDLDLTSGYLGEEYSPEHI